MFIFNYRHVVPIPFHMRRKYVYCIKLNFGRSLKIKRMKMYIHVHLYMLLMHDAYMVCQNFIHSFSFFFRFYLLQVYPGRDITNIVESSHYQKIGGWCRQGALNSAKCKGAQRWIKPFRCLGKLCTMPVCIIRKEDIQIFPFEKWTFIICIANDIE